MPSFIRCHILNSFEKSFKHLYSCTDAATIGDELKINPGSVNLPVLKSYCVKIAGVTASSAVLLNGYRLPKLYQPPVLKYMLE
jgi:hypothetical protein